MTFSTTLLMALCLFFTVAAADKPKQQLPILRTFHDFINEVDTDTDGSYRFKYHVGDSEREEQRTASGEVSGNYAFVAPEGDEYEFKYAADLEGYRVESEALPVHPEDTDDVKAAKEAFFAAYAEALERAEEESEEESDESYESYEDSDEDESSEESSEEDSEEDEEEEEEISNFIFDRSSKKAKKSPSPSNAATNFFGVPYPYKRN